jgi:hypothetical protein
LVEQRYAQVEAMYGRAAAYAILGATIVAAGEPPESLQEVAPVAACAILYVRFRGKAKQSAEASDADFLRLGQKFVQLLLDEWRHMDEHEMGERDVSYRIYGEMECGAQFSVGTAYRTKVEARDAARKLKQSIRSGKFKFKGMVLPVRGFHIESSPGLLTQRR